MVEGRLLRSLFSRILRGQQPLCPLYIVAAFMIFYSEKEDSEITRAVFI